MLDDDQVVAGLFQNGHELECCESPADIQVLKSAVQPAEDRGIITADIVDLNGAAGRGVVDGIGKYHWEVPGYLRTGRQSKDAGKEKKTLFSIALSDSRPDNQFALIFFGRVHRAIYIFFS